MTIYNQTELVPILEAVIIYLHCHYSDLSDFEKQRTDTLIDKIIVRINQ